MKVGQKVQVVSKRHELFGKTGTVKTVVPAEAYLGNPGEDAVYVNFYGKNLQWFFEHEVAKIPKK